MPQVGVIHRVEHPHHVGWEGPVVHPDASTAFAVAGTATAVVALSVLRPALKRAVTAAASIYNPCSWTAIVLRSIDARLLWLSVSLSVCPISSASPRW